MSPEKWFLTQEIRVQLQLYFWWLELRNLTRVEQIANLCPVTPFPSSSLAPQNNTNERKKKEPPLMFCHMKWSPTPKCPIFTQRVFAYSISSTKKPGQKTCPSYKICMTWKCQKNWAKGRIKASAQEKQCGAACNLQVGVSAKELSRAGSIETPKNR